MGFVYHYSRNAEPFPIICNQAKRATKSEELLEGAAPYDGFEIPFLKASELINQSLRQSALIDLLAWV